MANDNNLKKYIKYEDATYELADGAARAALAVCEERLERIEETLAALAERIGGAA